jgi:hypothetical protein
MQALRIPAAELPKRTVARMEALDRRFDSALFRRFDGALRQPKAAHRAAIAFASPLEGALGEFVPPLA